MSKNFNYRSKISINLKNLQHNYNVIKKILNPSTELLAMVKSNAYGHGILEVAGALESAKLFGVANCSEAQVLREGNINKKIIIMQGFLFKEELEYCIDRDCEMVINSFYQIEILQKLKIKKSLNIWLKLDIGMNRLGFKLEEFAIALSKLQLIENIKLEGVVGHFSNAESKKCSITKSQAKSFIRTINFYRKKHKLKLSLCKSSAMLFFPEYHFDMVRSGILLYGSSSFQHNIDIKPVMSFYSKVIAVHKIYKGETLGYNAQHIASNDSMIAVVGAGYGDGYPRNIPKNTKVFINEKEYPIVGRVSMDLIAVDISLKSNVQVADVVELWGENILARDLANNIDTISYELFCHLPTKVKREFINN